MCIGRGALYIGGSHTGRSGGRYTRENAGISSESVARNHTVECLRFPGEGSSTQGKSGPKVRAKAVADGQSVEIPIPPNPFERRSDTEGEACRGDGTLRVSNESGM